MAFDESFWVALAFVIFVALVYKPVSRVIAAALDGRADRISKELDEALRLKEEAQALLAEYQRDHRSATEEVEAIIQHAKDEAGRITKNAKDNLEKEVERRMDLVEQKIKQAEATVIQQLKDNAVDITTSAARTLILENLDKNLSEKIVGSAISDLDKKLH